MKVRIERLKEMIREEASEAILYGLTDPRLGFCTVTRVALANDLSFCSIHVSVLGTDGEKSKTLHALRSARGLIQSRIAARLRTRTTPHVEIELDESIEQSFAVLEKIKEARASDSDGGHSSPAASTGTRMAADDQDEEESDTDAGEQDNADAAPEKPGGADAQK